MECLEICIKIYDSWNPLMTSLPLKTIRVNKTVNPRVGQQIHAFESNVQKLHRKIKVCSQYVLTKWSKYYDSICCQLKKV